MSKKTRRRLDAGLKAKVALEALRNEAAVAELAAKCALLGLVRSEVYRKPAPADREQLALTQRIDDLATPFYGSRRMTAALRLVGRQVNRKRVQRLMRLMGLEALGPKPKTTRPAAQHRVYPYLLRGLAIGGTGFFITEVRAMTRVERVAMIARARADLSVRRQ